MPRLSSVGTVFLNARALLNDQDNQLFSNEVMMPYFGIAYEDIRQECEDNNISISNNTTAATVLAAGITDWGGPTGPTLPLDFVEPITMWENPGIPSQDYSMMEKKRFIPKTTTQTAYLGCYEYSGGYFKFIGATGPVNLKLDYVSIGLPDVVDENTIVKIRNAVLYLSFYTASMVSMYVGENTERATALNSQAERAMDRFLNINIKNNQSIVTRKRPFMSSFKRRRVGWSR